MRARYSYAHYRASNHVLGGCRALALSLLESRCLRRPSRSASAKPGFNCVGDKCRAAQNFLTA
ncbi:hypothetical protein CFBP498_48900 (plasmid) [Xanthomonas hortorum pv. vitians]|uniref:Uncharacterized protein n=1 Tax=Xanthomonas hortorum pv. vitians TaxID=83224 RepID=A0A6V7FKP2_9XANT|nr:hypothetical protein CFBP498_48900 [Xanthomonas hortorum pv. vitians]CAD0363528.1 hypothetical protein CFBP498_48900 [Xanthomonas hortorum pv. vitians]